MKAYKSIGYHRMSDGSVTSITILKTTVARELDGLCQNWDIDEIWTRDDNNEVDMHKVRYIEVDYWYEV